MNYIGYIHLLLVVSRNIYGYIIPASLIFDPIYLIMFTLLPLSWICLKGECIISYIAKKYKNNDYKMGDHPHDHTDISELFINNISYKIYYYISLMLYIGSLIIVNNRSNLNPNYLFYITIFLFLIYIIDNDLKINKYFQMVLITLLSSVMYNTYLKLPNYTKS